MLHALVTVVQEAAANGEAAGSSIGLIGVGSSDRGARCSVRGSESARSDQPRRRGSHGKPEATAQIQTAAIIFAALVEGTALFGLVLAFLLMNR